VELTEQAALHKDLSSSKLPAIDMNRLSTIENSIFNLNEKLRKEQRTKELLSWAKHDYGIDMTS
jgi:hypothetical protein